MEFLPTGLNPQASYNPTPHHPVIFASELVSDILTVESIKYEKDGKSEALASKDLTHYYLPILENVNHRALVRNVADLVEH